MVRFIISLLFISLLIFSFGFTIDSIMENTEPTLEWGTYGEISQLHKDRKYMLPQDSIPELAQRVSNQSVKTTDKSKADFNPGHKGVKQNLRQPELGQAMHKGWILVLMAAFIWIFVITKKTGIEHKLKTIFLPRNDEMEVKYQSVKSSLEEKETLLKEIHHRIKNNLQVVSSLLDLQSESITDSHALEAIKEGMIKVRSMSLIHEKLYRSGDLSNIDFQEYTTELLTGISSIFKSEMPVQHTVETSGISLNVDTTIVLGLILNEVVSNAYKYAFQEVEKGEIRVQLSDLGEGMLELQVSDNGGGIPENFDVNKTHSLGFRLLKTLTRQLKGELRYGNNGGATISVIFPEYKEELHPVKIQVKE